MRRSKITHPVALLFFIALTSPAEQFKFANQTLTVPDGFEVELVSTTNLVARPVSASFDEQGRLYVTDSSGSNEKVELQLANPNHRVLRLEDTDGDGQFDKSVVFADKLMFPEGCLWHDGSLYVAAPPSLWKLTDTNHDGVADVRVEWHQGKTLTGCANDLHGPFLGPDGWIYWCKGAFAEQTYEVNGQPFKSRAAHIFRARPDGSRLEPVMTGGMDNPVGIAFTAEGERILCGTFFDREVPGHRDGLIHAIYGGVYGKVNNVLDGHKRTGDLMPVMTHMGAAAPCAVIRYKSGVLGEAYRDNLFCCQFNLHKVSRHILKPDGATFKTTDSNFLVSDSTDFHPTDVIEDADGSLLVIDTGAWYKLCCPTSQLAKPDVLGAIYRIRRKGAPKTFDPLGLKLDWAKMNPGEMVKFLGDERIFVGERAIQELSKRGDNATAALAGIAISGSEHGFEPSNATNRIEWLNQYYQWKKAQIAGLKHTTRSRQDSLWALCRIGSPSSLQVICKGLDDLEEDVRMVAYSAISIHRFEQGGRDVLEKAHEYMRHREWRATFEVLGRTKRWNQLAALQIQVNFDNNVMDLDKDRVLRHSLSYSLIEGDSIEAANWFSRYDEFVPAALIALDQMDHGGLEAKQVIPYLSRSELFPEEKKTALSITSHHPEWGGALAGFFRDRLGAAGLTDLDRAELEQQLAQFTRNEAIQQLIAETLNAEATPTVTRQLLLQLMARAGLKQSPKRWADAVRAALEQSDEAIVRAATATARALGQIKTNPPTFAAQLHRLARDPARPDDLRLDALAGLPRGFSPIEPGLLEFLCANLDSSKSVVQRSAAVSALTNLKLDDDQLMTLAGALKPAGPLEVSKLLATFEQTTSEAVGLRLVAALQESKGLSGVNPGALKTLLARYPPTVQAGGGALLALLNVDEAKQRAHLEELLTTLPKGDVRGGQAVFNSPKAMCAACHQIGYLGGKFGPDLTKIGSIRTERDLLEAIVYPSASFVRSYEPITIITKSGEDYSGVVRKDAPDEIVLATGPNAEVSVPRSDIAELRIGKLSAMPSGLDGQLTKQELADLIAFLKAAK